MAVFPGMNQSKRGAGQMVIGDMAAAAVVTGSGGGSDCDDRGRRSPLGERLHIPDIAPLITMSAAGRFVQLGHVTAEGMRGCRQYL